MKFSERYICLGQDYGSKQLACLVSRKPNRIRIWDECLFKFGPVHDMPIGAIWKYAKPEFVKSKLQVRASCYDENALYDRGWTDKAIKRWLSRPTFCELGPTAHIHRYYLTDVVNMIEQTPEFQHWKLASQSRRTNIKYALWIKRLQSEPTNIWNPLLQ